MFAIIWFGDKNALGSTILDWESVWFNHLYVLLHHLSHATGRGLERLSVRTCWYQVGDSVCLSDSTIYMCYYTICHMLQGGVWNGSQSGPAGIRLVILSVGLSDLTILHVLLHHLSHAAGRGLERLSARTYWYQFGDSVCLSDSTIYMSYYTICNMLQGGVWNGSQSGPAGIRLVILSVCLIRPSICVTTPSVTCCMAGFGTALSQDLLVSGWWFCLSVWFDHLTCLTTPSVTCCKAGFGTALSQDLLVSGWWFCLSICLSVRLSVCCMLACLSVLPLFSFFIQLLARPSFPMFWYNSQVLKIYLTEICHHL